MVTLLNITVFSVGFNVTMDSIQEWCRDESLTSAGSCDTFRTMWYCVQIPLQSLAFQISHFFLSKEFLKVRVFQGEDSLNSILCYMKSTYSHYFSCWNFLPTSVRQIVSAQSLIQLFLLLLNLCEKWPYLQ